METETKEKRITKRADDDFDGSDGGSDFHGSCGSCNADVSDTDVIGSGVNMFNEIRNLCGYAEAHYRSIELENAQLKAEVTRLKLEIESLKNDVGY